MKKDFQQWATEKEQLEIKNISGIICKRGQIWIAKIGVNIGNECGKESPFLRPVLILETNIGGDLILVIPLTSQFNPYLERFLFPIEEKNLRNVCKNEEFFKKKKIMRKHSLFFPCFFWIRA